MKKTFLFFLSVGITLTLQAQISKTVNITTPGSLFYAFNSSEIKTITNLTITGTINAEDFKTMREELLSLEIVDISEVAIAAYSGTGGTATLNNLIDTTYSANEVPISAFFYTKIKSITLPHSLTSIGYGAFWGCDNLKSITIPPSVTNIGYCAFLNCDNINSITIPPSVAIIGDAAFPCLVEVDKDNLHYSSTDGILFNKNQTVLLSYPKSKAGSFIIPSTVLTIGCKAFLFCHSLTSITIPNSVTSIGDWAFWNCGLNTISIPSSVTSIGNYAFYECDNLSSIYSYSITPTNIDTSLGVFDGVRQDVCVLHIPFGTIATYKNANKWKDFTNIIEMGETSIPSSEDKKNLILYPNPVTDILLISNIDNVKQVEIINSDGRTTKLEKIKTNKINLSRLDKGIYLIRITTKSEIFTEKIIKQ